MALFEKVQKLGSEFDQELIHFYEQGIFPLEVRNLLPPQIEATICGDKCPGLDNLGVIRDFVTGLINLTEEHLNSGATLPIYVRHRLTTALQALKDQAQADPTPIFIRIQECIQFELELVKRAEAGGVMEQDPTMDGLNVVRQNVEGTGELLKRMGQEQDAFQICASEKQNLEEKITAVQNLPNQNQQTQTLLKSLKDAIAQKTTQLDQIIGTQITPLIGQFWQRITTNITNLSELQTRILQEKLWLWKFQQQKGANGLAPVSPISLDRVQMYVEALAELLWKTRQQVQEASRLIFSDHGWNLASGGIDGQVQGQGELLLQQVHHLITQLLNEVFIVEDQPPQVMKKANKFSHAPKVSILIGNLNIQMSLPQVSTCIIREAQARTYAQSETIDVAMPIINDKATFEFVPGTRRLTAKFCNLQLREIKRAERKGTGHAASSSESVMEEKLCMLFESQLQVGDIRVRVRTISLPVVVTSHGSQDPTAEATIMWDNAFGQLGRIPFQVPNRVNWVDLGQIMSAKFLTVTGRPLSEDNLKCLRNKAMKGTDHDTLTWGEFCKENLPDRNFSFWHWVYVALKNIEKKETHLKDLWREGHLVGFVDRDVAAEMMQNRAPGTFMLRFSDSKPGAISISVVNEDGSVFCIAPMDENDLKQKRLANCIRDLEKLKYLYPDIPKEEAFGKYYTAPEQLGKEYVHLISSIPDTNGSNGSRRNSSGLPVVITPPTDWNPGSGQQQMGRSGSPFDQQFAELMNQQSPGYGMGSPYGTGMPMSPITTSSWNPAPASPLQMPLNSSPYYQLPGFQSIPQQQPASDPMDLGTLNLNDIDEYISEHSDLLQVDPGLLGTPTQTSPPQQMQLPNSPQGGLNWTQTHLTTL